MRRYAYFLLAFFFPVAVWAGITDATREDHAVGGNSIILGNETVKGTITAEGAVHYDGSLTDIGDAGTDLLQVTAGVHLNGSVVLGDAAGDTVTVTGTMTVTPVATFSGGYLVTPPVAQTIAEGDTVTANACGGLKQITAAGGVTTGTTNTFTAPAAGNTGCCMDVVNVGGTNTITLDGNANFLVGGSNSTNVALTAGDSARVCSNGTTWYLISSYLTP